MRRPLTTINETKYNNPVTWIGLLYSILLGILIPDVIRGGSTSDAFENLELLLMVYPVMLLITLLIFVKYRARKKAEPVRQHANVFLVFIWILAYILITFLQHLLRLGDSTPGIYESDVFIILSLLFFIICFKILLVPLHFRAFASLILYIFVILFIHMFVMNCPINYSWMHTEDIVFLSSYYISSTALIVIYHNKSISAKRVYQ